MDVLSSGNRGVDRGSRISVAEVPLSPERRSQSHYSFWEISKIRSVAALAPTDGNPGNSAVN